MSETEQLRAKLDKIRRLLMTPIADQATCNCSYCPEVLRIIDGSSLEIPDNSPRILLEAVPDGEPCRRDHLVHTHFLVSGILFKRDIWKTNESIYLLRDDPHPSNRDLVPRDITVQPVRLVQVEP